MPLRRGFADCGTDLSPYCDTFGGAVLNVTTDRSAFATTLTADGNRNAISGGDMGVTDTFELGEPLNRSTLLLHGAVHEKSRLTRFIDRGTRALREFLDGSWHAIEGDAGRIVERGDRFEWALLMIRWGRLRNRDDAIAAAPRLISVREDHGTDAGGRPAISETGDDLSIKDDAARPWRQTEHLGKHPRRRFVQGRRCAGVAPLSHDVRFGGHAQGALT